MTILWFWRQNHYVGDYLRHVVDFWNIKNSHRHLKPVTKISKLSSSQTVTNIDVTFQPCHQYILVQHQSTACAPSNKESLCWRIITWVTWSFLKFEFYFHRNRFVQYLIRYHWKSVEHWFSMIVIEVFTRTFIISWLATVNCIS